MWTLPRGGGDIKAEEPLASGERNNWLVTTGGQLIGARQRQTAPIKGGWVYNVVHVGPKMEIPFE